MTQVRNRTVIFLLVAGLAVAVLWIGDSDTAGSGGEMESVNSQPEGPSLSMRRVAAKSPVGPERATPPYSGPRQEVAVRDLRTGRPVGGLRAIARLQEGAAWASEIECVADDLGVLSVPVEGLEALMPSGSRWKSAQAQLADILDEGEWWLYEAMAVTADVTWEGLSLTEPIPAHSFEARQLQEVGNDPARDAQRPGHPLWLMRNDLLSFPIKMRKLPRTTSAYRGDVPRFHGFHLVVRCPGWAVGKVPLNADEGTLDQPLRVSILLRRAFRIGGTLRDASGHTISGVTIELLTISTGTVEELDIDTAQLQVFSGGSPTLETDRTSGVSHLRTAQRTRVGSGGSFEFSLPLAGQRAYLVVSRPGHKQLRRELGPVGADMLGLELALLPRVERAARVRILSGGRPIPGGRLGANDVTDAVRQAAWFPISASGWIDAELLEEGHRYGLFVLDKKGAQIGVGYITWRGQSEIEITDLEREMESDR